MKLSDETMRQLAERLNAQKLAAQKMLDRPVPDLSGLGAQARAFIESARSGMSNPDTTEAMQAFNLPDNLPVMPFNEKWPWRGGDLQTIRNNLIGELADLSPWPSERILIQATDAEGRKNNDRLVLNVHAIADTDKPTLILIHGFTGCEDSYYVRRTAHYFLRRQYPIVRVNLRGAGPGRSFARQEYHAGRTEDFAAIADQLPANLKQHGLVAVGFSLGGNMLLKYVGEYGESAALRAAASVSAPINLMQTNEQFQKPRNRLYHRFMLKEYKRWVTHENMSQELRQRIDKANSIYEMDDLYVAWRYGFASADDYYKKNSAMGFLDDIRKPTLIIHAANDPWIPAQSYQPAIDSGNPALQVNLVEGGGHLGFHDDKGDDTWHDRRLETFLLEQGL